MEIKDQYQIYIPVEKIDDEKFIASKFEKITSQSYSDYKLMKKSIDARKRPAQYLFTFRTKENTKQYIASYQNVNNVEKTVHIIGAGPAGYFAALKCLELGIKPIVLERGTDVQSRRKDLRNIQQFGKINAHSNYCFGEGGAGTYSDGKLYTRSKKRGDIHEVLQILVDHGAKEDILLDAHPHIGSNKLPIVIKTIRETILEHGGEIRFNHFVYDFEITNQKISRLRIENMEDIACDHVILATGHSGREIYYLLDEKKIKLEPKEFALGVRVEHPQEVIDKIQYGQSDRHVNLPASKYSLSCQINDSGVYSFCMCPGGFIVPASTAEGELVVNGMSLSRRDSPFANSGIVTTITETILAEKYHSYGALKFLEFQKDIERKIFDSIPEKTQKAPAQRLIDFVENRKSKDLPKSSYIPGLQSEALHEILPEYITKQLQAAFIAFGKKMKGYLNNEAIIIAVESRTSSPVKIPREDDSLHHPEIINLYPCGEGAGYAGGIMSAAIDGRRLAEKISKLQD